MDARGKIMPDSFVVVVNSFQAEIGNLL